jgi:8-oxo-dGTP pyrophosphatase MutT (NUDIX family)
MRLSRWSSSSKLAEPVPSSRSLPPAFAERAREFATGKLTPVPARPASTVVLLRDAIAGLEVYLLRRLPSMAFAGGMQAFPGGAVDARDTDDDTALGWLGPSAAEWASRLGTGEPAARGFVCAAVREMFEESGVLLASAPGRLPVVPAGAAWEEARQDLVERRLALSELFERRGLAVRSDLLRPWAHWITPRFEPRRYDTWFFLAALPDGQHARDVSGEADRAAWARPRDAIAAAESGDVVMLPPTWSVLDQLTWYETVADALTAADNRRIETVTPGWVDENGEIRLVLPGDPAFPGDDPGEPA